MPPPPPPPPERQPRIVARLRRRLPLFLFAAAAVLVAFFAGMYVRHAEVFPFPLVRSAFRPLVTSTAGAVDDGIVSAHCAPVAGKFLTELQRSFHVPELICPAAHVARGGAAAARVEFLAGDELEDPVLMKGEVGTFLDQCPGPWGCLAVEYSRSGSVRRAWPFRPEEIAAANVAAESDYPYETSPRLVVSARRSDFFWLSCNECGQVAARSSGRRGVPTAPATSELTGRGAPA